MTGTTDQYHQVAEDRMRACDMEADQYMSELCHRCRCCCCCCWCTCRCCIPRWRCWLFIRRHSDAAAISRCCGLRRHASGSSVHMSVLLGDRKLFMYSIQVRHTALSTVSGTSPAADALTEPVDVSAMR